MEVLILMLQIMLGVLGLWSAVILFSIVKMMVTVRSIRGVNRRTDWLEIAAVGSIFVGSVTILVGHNHAAGDLCAVLMSFGTAALFFLFYITERHVQNLRNVREIKRSLTKE